MKLQKKSLRTPDKTNTFPKGKVAIVELDGKTFMLMTFEPGWKWSESIGPITGTQWCHVMHTSYHISGRLHVIMDDGTEDEFGPGDMSVIPPGHDAWTVGDETVVMLDIAGAMKKE